MDAKTVRNWDSVCFCYSNAASHLLTAVRTGQLLEMQSGLSQVIATLDLSSQIFGLTLAGVFHVEVKLHIVSMIVA